MAKRERRTDREMFLDHLSELSKGTTSIISGDVLSKRLRWKK
jgi:hypothetical protein